MRLERLRKTGVFMSPMLLHRKLNTLRALIAISESVGTAVSLFIEIDSSNITDSSPRNASGCNARIRLLSSMSFLIRKFLNACRPIYKIVCFKNKARS